MRRFYDNIIADIKSYQKTRISAYKLIIPSVIYATSKQSTESDLSIHVPILDNSIPDKRPRLSPSDILSSPRDPNTKSYKRKKTSTVSNTTITSTANDDNKMIVINNENLGPQY